MASVLIVEDEFILAYALDRALHRAGHTVVGIAPSFEKAVKIAETAWRQLALVDYQLEGNEDGVAVAHRLRPLGVKIIYVTAEPDAVRLVDGTTEIVPKPYDTEDLMQAVDRVVESAQSHE